MISKSGSTAETIGTYLVIRDRLQSELQKLSQLWSRGLVDAIKLADMGLSLEDISPTMVDGKSYFRTGRFFVATTGFSPSSVLYTQFHHKGRTIEELKKLAGEERFRGTDFDPYYAILPVPEGMGGRFSGFSPVGLLLLAVTANANLGETPRSRIRDAFFGIDSAIENALNNQVISNKNVAFKTAAISHIAEYAKNKTIELLYFFDPKLADVRVLLNELYSESLQEFGRGIDTKPLVGSMDNHMDWNGIIAGPRNKIIRFVTTKDYDPVSNLRIPSGSGIKGDVQAIESLTLGEVQNSACFGTSSDATKPSRQEQDKAIELPGVLNFSQILNNKSVKNNAEFIFTLMLETAILGKLNGLEVEKSPDGTVKDLTYLQYWVEGYKKAMRARCAELKRQRNDNGGNLYDNVEEIVRIMENYLHVEGNRNTGYSFHVTLTETKDIDVHMHNEDLYGGRVYIILKGSVNTNRFAKGEIHFEYFNIRHQGRKLGTEILKAISLIPEVRKASVRATAFTIEELYKVYRSSVDKINKFYTIHLEAANLEEEIKKAKTQEDNNKIIVKLFSEIIKNVTRDPIVRSLNLDTDISSAYIVPVNLNVLQQTSLGRTWAKGGFTNNMRLVIPYSMVLSRPIFGNTVIFEGGRDNGGKSKKNKNKQEQEGSLSRKERRDLARKENKLNRQKAISLKDKLINKKTGVVSAVVLLMLFLLYLKNSSLFFVNQKETASNVSSSEVATFVFNEQSISRLRQTLSRMGYSEQDVALLEDNFKELLNEINFIPLANSLKSPVTENNKIKFFETILSLKQKKYSFGDDLEIKPLNQLLVNLMLKEDIFTQVKESNLSEQAKTRSYRALMQCANATTLMHVVLQTIGYKASGAIAPMHMFNVVVENSDTLFFLDFSEASFFRVAIPRYYEAKGKYLILKEERKIDAQRLLSLTKLLDAGRLNLLYLSQDEIINLLYPQIQIIDENAFSSFIHNNTGTIYQELGQIDAAIVTFNKAIQIYPHNATAYYNLANLYLKLNDLAKAKFNYEKAI